MRPTLSANGQVIFREWALKRETIGENEEKMGDGEWFFHAKSTLHLLIKICNIE